MRMRVVVKRNDFGRVGKQIPILADRIINRQYGPQMAALAALLSRVDTGEMQGNWIWRRTAVGEGELVNDTPYVVYNEYGTRFMAAQPMARPAIERFGPLIVEAFAQMERYLR